MTLDGSVYLSPNLSAAAQDALRYQLAGILLDTEKRFLQGESQLATGGPNAQSTANKKFNEAQQQLASFVQVVQQNTASAQHPTYPLSQATSAALIASAQQASTAIGALMH